MKHQKPRVRLKSRVNPGPNFRGYKPNYDHKRKEFVEPYQFFKINEEAIAMVKLSSGSKAHVKGTERLAELDFDPIKELVEEIQEIKRLMDEELARPNPRSTYLGQLSTSRLRILEALLPYGYGKAPVTTVNEVDYRDPIRIILHDESNDSGEES